MATWTPDNSLFSLAAGCEHISPMMLSPSNGAERGPALSALPLIIFPKASYNSFSPIQRLWDRGAEWEVGGAHLVYFYFTSNNPSAIQSPWSRLQHHTAAPHQKHRHAERNYTESQSWKSFWRFMFCQFDWRSQLLGTLGTKTARV